MKVVTYRRPGVGKSHNILSQIFGRNVQAMLQRDKYHFLSIIPVRPPLGAVYVAGTCLSIPRHQHIRYLYFSSTYIGSTSQFSVEDITYYEYHFQEVS